MRRRASDLRRQLGQGHLSRATLVPDAPADHAKIRRNFRRQVGHFSHERKFPEVFAIRSLGAPRLAGNALSTQGVYRSPGGDRMTTRTDLGQEARRLAAQWKTDARWSGVERPYSAEQVIRLRGTIRE